MPSFVKLLWSLLLLRRYGGWCADGAPDCDVTVTQVSCNVTLYASNIDKALESLVVGPVVLPARCQSVVTRTSASQFLVEANVDDVACSSLDLAVNATQLTGNLVSAIDDRLPDYRYTIATPHRGQGIRKNIDLLRCVVDLLYNKTYSKSATDRSSGVLIIINALV